LSRALTLFREPLLWRLLQLQAMTREFSWDASAAKFIELYQDVAQTTRTEEIVLEGGEDEDTARRAAG